MFVFDSPGVVMALVALRLLFPAQLRPRLSRRGRFQCSLTESVTEAVNTQPGRNRSVSGRFW